MRLQFYSHLASLLRTRGAVLSLIGTAMFFGASCVGTQLPTNVSSESNATEVPRSSKIPNSEIGPPSNQKRNQQEASGSIGQIKELSESDLSELSLAAREWPNNWTFTFQLIHSVGVDSNRDIGEAKGIVLTLARRLMHELEASSKGSAEAAGSDEAPVGCFDNVVRHGECLLGLLWAGIRLDYPTLEEARNLLHARCKKILANPIASAAPYRTSRRDIELCSLALEVEAAWQQQNKIEELAMSESEIKSKEARAWVSECRSYKEVLVKAIRSAASNSDISTNKNGVSLGGLSIQALDRVMMGLYAAECLTGEKPLNVDELVAIARQLVDLGITQFEVPEVNFSLAYRGIPYSQFRLKGNPIPPPPSARKAMSMSVRPVFWHKEGKPTVDRVGQIDGLATASAVRTLLIVHRSLVSLRKQEGVNEAGVRDEAGELVSLIQERIWGGLAWISGQMAVAIETERIPETGKVAHQFLSLAFGICRMTRSHFIRF